MTSLSDVENVRCTPNLSTLKRRLKIAIAFIIKTEILHLLIQKTLNYIKANQVLTKEKTGVPVGMVRASHRDREVTGSNPVDDLNFSGFHTQLQILRSYL